MKKLLLAAALCALAVPAYADTPPTTSERPAMAAPATSRTPFPSNSTSTLPTTPSRSRLRRWRYWHRRCSARRMAPRSKTAWRVANDRQRQRRDHRAAISSSINLDGTRRQADQQLLPSAWARPPPRRGLGRVRLARLGPFSFTHLLTGFDEGLHSLANGYDNYAFFYNNTDMQRGLRQSERAGQLDRRRRSGVPEPSTWAMLVRGFGLLGLVGWKKRGARLAI